MYLTLKRPPTAPCRLLVNGMALEYQLRHVMKPNKEREREIAARFSILGRPMLCEEQTETEWESE